jgi:cbb3-type cytochrome oxidase subunit 3
MSLSDIMAAAGLGSWAVLGLIVSFATFSSIVVWVLVRRRSSWEHARRLPLDDGDTAAPGSGGSLR